MKTKVCLALNVVLLGLLAWLVGQNHRLSTLIHLQQPGFNDLARSSHISAARNLELNQQSESAPPIQPKVTPGVGSSRAGAEWNDPNWRAARFDEAYLQVEAEHGRFFRKLTGWAPEQLEVLKRRLAENALALMKAATQQRSSDDPLSTRTLGETIRQAKLDNQARLRALLDENEYAAFEETERIETYRGSVDSISNAMRSRSIEISPDREEVILTAYANAMLTASRTSHAVDISRLSPEQVTLLKREQMNEFHRVLLDKMSAVLDENQLNIFMEAEIEQQHAG